MPNGYPNYPEKYDKAAIFDPIHFLEYLHNIGQMPDLKAPRFIIICHQRRLYEYVLRVEKTPQPKKSAGYPGLITLSKTGHQIGVIGNFGFGAAKAASTVEELIALGATHFVAIGTAGSMQPDLRIGQIILCEQAIRDEGISYHYLSPAKYIRPSRLLTEALEVEFRSREPTYITGQSWTIDAIYRETIAEVCQYQHEGTACAEMESAAIFAVGAYRSAEVASIFVIGDSIFELPWEPHWHKSEVVTSLIAAFEVTVATLVKLVSRGGD